MGTNYIIVNHDVQEYIDPADWGEGRVTRMVDLKEGRTGAVLLMTLWLRWNRKAHIELVNTASEKAWRIMQEYSRLTLHDLGLDGGD